MTPCPSSTIKSKKLTACTAQTMMLKVNNTKKKYLLNSIKSVYKFYYSTLLMFLYIIKASLNKFQS